MRIIVDTNILVSGVFFGGLPGKILEFWKQGKLQLVASQDIFNEYLAVIIRFSKKYPSIEVLEITDLLFVELEMVKTKKLKTKICRDPGDDKFIACAISAQVGVVVSGDKDLLSLRRYKTVLFLSPSKFLATFQK